METCPNRDAIRYFGWCEFPAPPRTSASVTGNRQFVLTTKTTQVIDVSIDNIKNESTEDKKFKEFIRRTDVLAAFLHAYVDEFKDCSRDTIIDCIQKENTDKYVQERNVFPDSGKKNGIEVDTLFRVKLPESDSSVAVYVNIEGQNKYYLPYKIERRVEAYVSELIAAQKGIEYKKQEYDKIKKIYSIWLLFDHPNRRKNAIIRYDRTPNVIYGDLESNKLNFDLANITIVYVGAYNEELSEAMGLVTALFGSGLTDDERYATLADKYKIQLNDEDNRRLRDIVSWAESFYVGYEECKRISETEGRAKGMAEGRAEGMAEGMAEGRIESTSENVATVVKKYGVSVDQAIEDFNVPEDIRDEVRRRAMDLLAE